MMSNTRGGTLCFIVITTSAHLDSLPSSLNLVDPRCVTFIEEKIVTTDYLKTFKMQFEGAKLY